MRQSDIAQRGATAESVPRLPAVWNIGLAVLVMGGLTLLWMAAAFSDIPAMPQ